MSKTVRYNGVLDGYPNVVDDSPLLARMFNVSGSPVAGSWIQQNIDDESTESLNCCNLVLTAGDVFGLTTSDLDGIDQSLIGTQIAMEIWSSWTRGVSRCSLQLAHSAD